MNSEAIITVIISVFSSSLFTIIVSSLILEPIREKNKFIFSEKQSLYISLIMYAQMILSPKTKSSIKIEAFNIEALNDEESINYAINALQAAIPKVKLITKNEQIVNSIYAFIKKQDNATLHQLINILRKDLYK